MSALGPGTCGAVTAALVMWGFTLVAVIRAYLGAPGAVAAAVICGILAVPFTIAGVRDYRHDRRWP